MTEQTNQHTESKILRQVKALLNVTSTRGATEEEAQNAAAEVQELLLRQIGVREWELEDRDYFDLYGRCDSAPFMEDASL